jgi:hypothetical protein
MASPTIKKHPVDVLVREGDAATFKVEAEPGEANKPLKYRWYHRDEPVPTATNGTAETDTLNLEAVKLADAGTYRVEVAENGEWTTSNAAILSVEKKEERPLVWDPAVAKGAAEWLLVIGLIFLVPVVVVAARLAFAEVPEFPGVIATQLAMIGLLALLGGIYLAILDHRGRSRKAEELAEEVVQRELDIILAEREEERITGVPWVEALKAAPDALNAFGKLSAMGALLVTAIVLFIASAALGWRGLGADEAAGGPEIVTQPQSVEAAEGDDVTLTVEVEGEDLEFQWRKGEDDLEDGDGVEGATTATLKLTAVDADDAGDYTVVVSSADGEVTSDTATVSVA